MEFKEIRVEIRTPTVQYGYINTEYVITINEDEGETPESAIRYVHAVHRDAMVEVNLDAESKKKILQEELWNDTPY